MVTWYMDFRFSGRSQLRNFVFNIIHFLLKLKSTYLPSMNPKKHSTPNQSFLLLGSCEFIWHDFSWHFMTCAMQLRIFGVSCHLCTAASHATNQSSTHRARRDKTSSCSSVRHGWGENQGLRISKWCKENRGGFSRGAWMIRKMAGSSMTWYFPTSVVSHLLL